MTFKHSSLLLILGMSVTWIKRFTLKMDQSSGRYYIKHKETHEIRVGVWDSEYLNFITDMGVVSWDEYYHWKPYDMPVVVPQFEPQPLKITKDNHLMFVDLNLTLKSGESRVVATPLELTSSKNGIFMFSPVIGRLLFWQCNDNGCIPGRKEKVYQLPLAESKKIIELWNDVSKQLCNVCLGVNDTFCHKCIK